MQDQLILDRGNVRISRSVAQFGNTTYAINALGSIRVDAPVPRTLQKLIGMVMTFGGLFIGAAFGAHIHEQKQFIESDKPLAFLVIALVGLGIAIWASAKPGPYSLFFRTSSGDIQAYASYDKHDIMEIKQAIEYALHLRA